MVVLIVVCLGVNVFVLFAPYICFRILVKLTEWQPIDKIAAHSANDVFSWFKYLIVYLVFFQPLFLEWESFSRLFLVVANLYLLIHYTIYFS